MPEYQIRPVVDDDRPAVLRLLTRSLGWEDADEFAEFFAWKHDRNSFGASPGWVAVDGGDVIGFRTFLRWEFAAGGRIWRAVRAVDTATHPDHQGRGIFRALTEHALADLVGDGVDFVFNTPNDRSRPGYLKMGWSIVGDVPIATRPTSLLAPVRMLRSRVAAERWSVEGIGGRRASDVLASVGVEALLDDGGEQRLRTRQTIEHLRWRYGFARLGYRAVTAGRDPGEGVAVFRVRRRGAAAECALVEMLTPTGDDGVERHLTRAVVRAARADYVVRVSRVVADRSGFVRVPGQGPTLTWRPVNGEPPGSASDDWDLALGDVELF